MCPCAVCDLLCVTLQSAYVRARTILTRHESELHALASELLEKETLGGDQITVIMKQVSTDNCESRP
jgi:ATP-dependent metalloprotease